MAPQKAGALNVSSALPLVPLGMTAEKQKYSVLGRRCVPILPSASVLTHERAEATFSFLCFRFIKRAEECLSAGTNVYLLAERVCTAARARQHCCNKTVVSASAGTTALHP